MIVIAMAPEIHPRVLIGRKEIEAVVKCLAGEISKDYHDKHPVIISVLKSSFMFTADLLRHLDFPLEVEFIRLSSYGKEKESSGKIEIIQGISIPIEGRHVLILEDIIDTGQTTSFLMKYLAGYKPASIKICALTDKPSRRQCPINIDYSGFTVPDKFIVGYGMDCGEEYRYLPDICVLEEA